jgi:fermentation-respiration switch protein FrsA (DUF1100 family)
MPRWRRAVIWFVVLLIAIVIAVKLVVWRIEPRLAFYPVAGVQETPTEVSLPFTDVQIRTADGEALHGWWLEDPSARAQVVFWHGNGGNLSEWLPAIAGLRRHGFSVLAVDYRGYGASTGAPSERGVYRDADATIAMFRERFGRPGTPVIYWGRSMGSAVAAYAASRQAPGALVLESPFPSLRAVVANNPVLWTLSFFSSYSFPTARFLDRYDGPLLVVHGDADSIVPFAVGRTVFDAARTTRKTFVTIHGADHNDLHAANPELYWSSISRWVDELFPPALAPSR